MQGRRVDWPDGAIPIDWERSAAGCAKLEPGDYSGPWRGLWYFCTPNGHTGCIDSKIHSVTEHEDGTVTVAPSISLRQGSLRHGGTELWHGYLERGVWRTV